MVTVGNGICAASAWQRMPGRRANMSLRHTTAAENDTTGVEPLGGLAGLPPAKASIPVRRRCASR